MKKRLTSCLLTLSMLLSMLPVSAFATEAETPPEGPGSEIIIGDIPLVRNGVPTGEPFPAGASYDQGSSTLTLGSASLGPRPYPGLQRPDNRPERGHHCPE